MTIRILALTVGLAFAAACSTAPTALPQDFDPSFAY